MAKAFHLYLLSLLSSSFSLTETMPRKFQGFGENTFGGFEDSKMAAQTCSVVQVRKVGFMSSKQF